MIYLIETTSVVAPVSSEQFGVVSPTLFEGVKVTKDG